MDSILEGHGPFCEFATKGFLVTAFDSILSAYYLCRLHFYASDTLRPVDRRSFDKLAHSTNYHSILHALLSPGFEPLFYRTVHRANMLFTALWRGNA